MNSDDSEIWDDPHDYDADVTVFKLTDHWPNSTASPHSLFESVDPPVQVGTFRIEPGKRVPSEGWTSHEGPEVSLLLDGTLQLVTRDGERTLSSGSVSIISASVDHYSVNSGPTFADIFYVISGEP